MVYLRLLRPSQWIKNLFVFAGLVFGRKLSGPEAGENILLTLIGFVCLCLVSSAVYVVNDIHDREEDKLHPRKRTRPIAAGQVTVAAATVLTLVLLIFGLGGSWVLDPGFGLVVTAYLVLQTLYTFGFKHAVILDVISIGLGFVLRAVSGAVLVHVAISPWLVLCTFTLCLFMGFSKRRCELNALAGQNAGGAGKHRKTLAIYTPDLLNHMTTVTAGIAIVSFLLYTIDARTIAEFGAAAGERVELAKTLGRFGSQCLLYTIPIVVYAVFRFAVLVEHGEVDGPTDVVVRDRPFQIAILLWTVAAMVIVYRTEQLYELLQRILN